MNLFRWVAPTLPADRMHQPLGLNESGGVDLMPLPLGGDGFTDGTDDLFIAGAAAQQAADVGLLEGEQAVAQLAVGGQADPVAAHTEGAADRGDHADASAAINVIIIDGRGARVLVRGWNKRSDLLRQPFQDLGGEEDLFTFPQAPIQRHVLDEPYFQSVLPGETGERNNVLFGAPLHRHRVDLDRIETGRLRRENPLDHLLETGP